jgi:hypothetical protein
MPLMPMPMRHTGNRRSSPGQTKVDQCRKDDSTGTHSKALQPVTTTIPENQFVVFFGLLAAVNNLALTSPALKTGGSHFLGPWAAS